MPRKKQKKSSNNPQGIGGWIIILILDFILSAIGIMNLLAQRVISIMSGKALWGVYVSVFLLVFYCIFIIYSICLILMKKKIAIDMSIITLIIGLLFLMWYYIIGYSIFYSKIPAFNIFILAANIALSIIIIAYFKKSKRVKNTLVR